jgi:hypothetical protein
MGKERRLTMKESTTPPDLSWDSKANDYLLNIKTSIELSNDPNFIAYATAMGRQTTFAFYTIETLTDEQHSFWMKSFSLKSTLT